MPITSGAQVYHPEHGMLTVIESNDFGQLFCNDDDDVFFLFNEDDDGLTIIMTPDPLEEEEVDGAIEFANTCVEAAISDKAMIVLFDIDEDTAYHLATRNVNRQEIVAALTVLLTALEEDPLINTVADN